MHVLELGMVSRCFGILENQYTFDQCTLLSQTVRPHPSDEI